MSLDLKISKLKNLNTITVDDIDNIYNLYNLLGQYCISNVIDIDENNSLVKLDIRKSSNTSNDAFLINPEKIVLRQKLITIKTIKWFDFQNLNNLQVIIQNLFPHIWKYIENKNLKESKIKLVCYFDLDYGNMAITKNMLNTRFEKLKEVENMFNTVPDKLVSISGLVGFIRAFYKNLETVKFLIPIQYEKNLIRLMIDPTPIEEILQHVELNKNTVKFSQNFEEVNFQFFGESLFDGEFLSQYENSLDLKFLKYLETPF